MSDQVHPQAPHHLPGFITGPGETDVLMIAMGVFLIVVVLVVGNLYLQLHTLPERMAHKSQKLQFEIVAVLGLLALFTHVHIFWIAGLLLALIDIPDFSTPLRSIAGSVAKMAGVPLGADSAAMPSDLLRGAAHDGKGVIGKETAGKDVPGKETLGKDSVGKDASAKASADKSEVRGHA